MELKDFLNSNPSALDILAAPPYSIKIKNEGDYYLFKYEQFTSDMSSLLVQQSRGIIFKKEDNSYRCVCHPFDKFFNYGESNAHSIDWNTAKAREKIDGSLMKVWFDEYWHISTNGCISADTVSLTSDSDTNYGALFRSAVDNRFDEFTKYLDETHCYMFELVSPKNRMVVKYDETCLYYLGERDMSTDVEEYVYDDKFARYGIKAPAVYHLNTLEDVIKTVNMFSEDQEGIVVCDNSFNRIKIKGSEYLKAFSHRCISNTSSKSIVELIKNEQIDDFISYNPEIKEKYEVLLSKIKLFKEKLDGDYSEILSKSFDSRKDLSIFLFKNMLKSSDYIFKRLDGKISSADEYIWSLASDKIIKMIE